MTLIVLTGPNAIGKTTALYRWCARYPRLVGISADGGWIVRRDSKTPAEDDWKKDAARKQAIVEAYATRPGLYLIESARTDLSRFAGPEARVILVTTTPEMLQRNLEARCAARGKKYNAAYWTVAKRDYESSRRYINHGQRWCKHVTTFNLATYEDWAAVDAYFGKLYRQLQRI